MISEFNPKRRRIIGDRKQLLVAKKLEQQKELFAKIKVGDVMEGTVKNVTDFGAFIDLRRSRRTASYFRDVLGQS